MSAKSNAIVKVIGLALLVGGICLAFWGYQMSGAFVSKLTRGLTGTLPDAVINRYISGAICSVIGLLMLTKK